MRIVVDTNVIVSGLLSPFNPSGHIVKLLTAGKLVALYDSRIISEYKDVMLRPKFDFNLEHMGALLEQIECAGEIVACEPLSYPLPDREDEPFLEAAFSGKAACLITVNLRHYPVRVCQSIRVLSPQKFIEFYTEYS